MKIELSVGGKVIVIEAEGSVSVRVMEECPEFEKAVAVAPVKNVPEEAVPGDGLFATLSELRKELAMSAGVPPYVVFKDSTLREIVEKRPADLEAFGQISGVGKAKLEKYGAAFLAALEGVAA